MRVTCIDMDLGRYYVVGCGCARADSVLCVSVCRMTDVIQSVEFGAGERINRSKYMNAVRKRLPQKPMRIDDDFLGEVFFARFSFSSSFLCGISCEKEMLLMCVCVCACTVYA